jgi:hypothetical protein
MKMYKLCNIVIFLSWCIMQGCGEKDPDPPTNNPFAYEVCNGLDDDGDDKIDENEGGGVLRRTCSTACGTGKEECIGGQWLYCDAPVPLPESCNGFDDDCDGHKDEDCDCIHGVTEACAPEGAGPGCPGGLIHCRNGIWSECQLFDDLDSLEELCGDDKDNDCDGDVDEGCACDPEDTQDCGTDEGTCAKGVQTCGDDGQWGSCEGGVGPEPEVCNGLDDDCDGDVDSSSSYIWKADRLEQNESCGPGNRIGRVTANQNVVVLVEGTVNGPPENFPTLYPSSEVDWYKGTVQCPANPASAHLRVTLQLIDALQPSLEHIHPNFMDYRFCVNFGESCLGLVEDAERCTHGTNWHSATYRFTLDVPLAGQCNSNEEVPFYIRIDSPTLAGCGYYDLRVQLR